MRMLENIGEKLGRELLAGWIPRAFVAIDFETANRNKKSACAVALARVEKGKVVKLTVELIRPPMADFDFTYIHGISWSNVKAKPPFKSVWRGLLPYLENVEFLAAHNAGFDQDVLTACCRDSGLAGPPLPFVCTVQLARQRWQLYPTKLPNVCEFLGLPLKHHDPLSDAEACARIVLAVIGKN